VSRETTSGAASDMTYDTSLSAPVKLTSEVDGAPHFPDIVRHKSTLYRILLLQQLYVYV